MSEIASMIISLTTQRCKAASSFGGAAMSVHKARCTAGRLPQIIALGTGHVYKDALAVLGKSFVNATRWKLYVLKLLLILMLKRMVSVLLKSQAQQAQSIAGCQMSLEPNCGLWLSAQPTGSD